MERSSSLCVQFTIQVTRKMRYLLKVARLPGFELRLHHLLVELPGASHLSSLSLSFPLGKMWDNNSTYLHRVTVRIRCNKTVKALTLELLSFLGTWGDLLIQQSVYEHSLENQKGLDHMGA